MGIICNVTDCIYNNDGDCTKDIIRIREGLGMESPAVCDDYDCDEENIFGGIEALKSKPKEDLQNENQT